MRLVWTDPAEEDMWGIVEFIAADNPDAALTMQERFHAAAESLLDFPYKGRPGRAPGTRELVIAPSYLLVYGVDAQCIRILRLFHAARDHSSWVCR